MFREFFGTNINLWQEEILPICHHIIALRLYCNMALKTKNKFSQVYLNIMAYQWNGVILTVLKLAKYLGILLVGVLRSSRKKIII